MLSVIRHCMAIDKTAVGEHAKATVFECRFLRRGFPRNTSVVCCGFCCHREFSQRAFAVPRSTALSCYRMNSYKNLPRRSPHRV